MFSSSAFAICRLNTDGTPDFTFNRTGLVVTDIPHRGPFPEAGVQSLALQPDGKIVAAGFLLDNSPQRVVVARYNEDGTLDPTFANTGITTPDLGALAAGVGDIAILPNDEILVAGSAAP